MNKVICLIMNLILSLFIAQTSLASKPGAADANHSSVLEISDAWARKSMSPNNNSAAYMKIHNPTDEQITIISASAMVVANNVELHKSFVDEGGISRMTAIDKIVVPAKSTIELKPGGIHIMLIDLKYSLSEGNKFIIKVKIQNSDPIGVETMVK
ncbi:MAG: hypothetical protein COA94_04290 [Rickettsiales bacterium]|nr:MAG: hypothetical protein COA94_04290 [Rickettsiales bacterium]